MLALRSRSVYRASGPRPTRAPTRRALSVVLIAIVLVVMVGFVALAVDYGRVRVTKTQLQNAADSAALAAVDMLGTTPDSVVETQDRAADAAAENFALDQASAANHGAREDSIVDLVVDEDIEFGLWNYAKRRFDPLNNDSGGIDERREANAVRVWGRRVTNFKTEDGVTITRNTGLPLIFAPVVGVQTGEVQAYSVAAFTGGQVRYGFVGIDSVRFVGTTKTDSYNAAIESYPGSDGTPNQNSSIISDGNITLVGGTQIWGDVHPGVDHSIQPYPLGGNVQVTGFMDPLDKSIKDDFPITAFVAPTTQPYNISGSIQPPSAKKGSSPGYFQSARNTLFQADPARAAATQPTLFYFKSSGANNAWTSGSQDRVNIDNRLGELHFYIDGDFKNAAQAQIHIWSNNYPVKFWINGNCDMQGGGIFNDQGGSPATVKPDILYINMTKPGTTLDVGGSPTMSAHIYAPESDIKFHGNGNGIYGFWGWAVGKTLTVDGGYELHYDESYPEKNYTRETHVVDNESARPFNLSQ
jgi:hypothetical protein